MTLELEDIHPPQPRARFWARFAPPNDAMRVFRWAWIGLMIGWYCKVSFFFDDFVGHRVYPMSHPSFEGWRADARVMWLLYTLPALASFGLLNMTRVRLLVASCVGLVCSAGLLLHVSVFNDATFTTSFWVCVWLTWLGWNCQRRDIELVYESRRLAMMIVSLMFLGGFMGKLTPEFWSGEMFFNYFFLDRDILHYPWLRENLEVQQLREVATWFSRGVVVMEGVLAAMWIFKFRNVAPFMIVVMACMTAGSTPWLLSVFGCLMAMLAANYAWYDE